MRIKIQKIYLVFILFMLQMRNFYLYIYLIINNIPALNLSMETMKQFINWLLTLCSWPSGGTNIKMHQGQYIHTLDCFSCLSFPPFCPPCNSWYFFAKMKTVVHFTQKQITLQKFQMLLSNNCCSQMKWILKINSMQIPLPFYLSIIWYLIHTDP